ADRSADDGIRDARDGQRSGERNAHAVVLEATRGSGGGADQRVVAAVEHRLLERAEVLAEVVADELVDLGGPLCAGLRAVRVAVTGGDVHGTSVAVLAVETE